MSEMKIKAGIDPNSQRQNPSQNTPEVDVNDEESLKKWSFVLRISKSELIEAVKIYGPKVRDIRLGLSKAA